MNTKNIYTAIAEFQQECPVIFKGTKGYGYEYADLPAILEVINPLLKKHGLGFTQILNNNSLETTVFHIESGESIKSSIEIPDESLKGMNKFQVLGSAITYLRRYSLSAMLGIVTDKDNDAAGAPEPKTEQKKLPELTNDKIDKAAQSLAKGETTIEIIQKHYRISPMTMEQLENAVEQLRGGNNV